MITGLRVNLALCPLHPATTTSLYLRNFKLAATRPTHFHLPARIRLFLYLQEPSRQRSQKGLQLRIGRGSCQAQPSLRPIRKSRSTRTLTRWKVSSRALLRSSEVDRIRIPIPPLSTLGDLAFLPSLGRARRPSGDHRSTRSDTTTGSITQLAMARSRPSVLHSPLPAHPARLVRDLLRPFDRESVLDNPQPRTRTTQTTALTIGGARASVDHLSTTRRCKRDQVPCFRSRTVRESELDSERDLGQLQTVGQSRQRAVRASTTTLRTTMTKKRRKRSPRTPWKRSRAILDRVRISEEQLGRGTVQVRRVELAVRSGASRS